MNLRLMGGIFMVASLSVGAGMLALPLTIGKAGFIASAIALVAIFFFMLYNLLLLLEANFYVPSGSNLISMVKAKLGIGGEFIAWFMYLLLLYAVLAAYTSAGESVFSGIIQNYLHKTSPTWLTSLLFIVIFGMFVHAGTRSVDYLNRLLTIGLIAAYIILVVAIFPHIQPHLLTNSHSMAIFAGIPVIALSFTSHVIVPSLRVYYRDNIKHLLTVLIAGTTIPLLLYLLWQLIVIGVIPLIGEHSLSTLHTVNSLTYALSRHTGSLSLGTVATIFSIFALVTSFLGVSLSLSHFLKDGLRQSNKPRARLANILLTYAPPFLFAIIYPQGFSFALGYAGVFVAVLFGILPSLMVWKARYVEQLPSRFRVPGGKPALLLVMAVSLLIIVLQILVTIGIL